MVITIRSWDECIDWIEWSANIYCNPLLRWSQWKQSSRCCCCRWKRRKITSEEWLSGIKPIISLFNQIVSNYTCKARNETSHWLISCVRHLSIIDDDVSRLVQSSQQSSIDSRKFKTNVVLMKSENIWQHIASSHPLRITRYRRVRRKWES